MPSTLSRRRMIVASSTVSLAALSGCAGFPFGSSESPLTIRASNTSDREFRVEVVLLKPNATHLADAKVVDESYMVQPTDGFQVLTEVETQRYHVRTRLSGMGYISEQYEYQYYPSCDETDELSPTLSLVIHPESEAGHPFIGFSQAECGAST